MGSAESRRLKNAQSAVDFIEKHLDGSLSLDRTAAAVHYSKYHLHRVFADTTGMTIHDYTLRRQLTEGGVRLSIWESIPGIGSRRLRSCW